VSIGAQRQRRARAAQQISANPRRRDAAAGPDREPWQSGITLLELLLVLAVIVLVVGLAINITRRVSDAELREKGVELVALLRQAYAMTAQTGVHHRLFIDLDAQKVRLETCEDSIRLKKTDKEEEIKKEMLDELKERPQTVTDLPEMKDADSPEKAVAAAAALEGVRVGSARCKPAKEFSPDARGRGSEREIGNDFVNIRRVYAQHLRDPAEKGIATVNFFPLGYAEKAVIELADRNGDTAYVLVHRLTGQVELKVGEFDYKEHMGKDGAGRTVGEDR
jgi:general secretion pathway protein H